MKSYTLWILFLGLPLSLQAAYLWPLQENFGVSATFGESRSDHFHAGIDLSTNGEIGLPVLAVADGEIYRLKIQKRGYGKALYLRHADGMISVYAHLDSYSTELGLERVYQKRVVETGTRYTGDIFLDPPILVKQGTTIAYSGETGAGLPHLHLELRKNEAEPVNPLLHGFTDNKDPIAPTFQAVYFYPLDASSAIDGKPDMQIVRLFENKGIYRPVSTPVVRGEFHVSVSTYDSALRPYHRAPYKISFSIDGRLLYELQFQQFSYTEPERFGLIYDLGKPGPSYFEYPLWLANPASIQLPFVVTSIPFSTRRLAPGMHRMQIEAVDANQNSSLAHIDFVVNNPPSILFTGIHSDGKDLIVNSRIQDEDWPLSIPVGLALEIEYSTDEGKTFYPFPLTTLDVEGSQGSAHYISRIPLGAFTSNRILIKARGYDGIEYSPYALSALRINSTVVPEIPEKPPEGRLMVTPYRSAIHISFDTTEIFPASLEVGVGKNRIPLKPVSLNTFEAVIPAPPMTGPLVVQMDSALQATLPVQYVTQQTGAVVQGENYEVHIPKSGLYWDSFAWTKTMVPYRTSRLTFVGSILEITPRGLPLQTRGKVVFHYPSNIKYPEKLSIYSWNRAQQRWESQPSHVDQVSRTVRTNITYFDLFALIYDNVPPRIGFIFPRRNSVTLNQTPKLAAHVTDLGMDVDDEKITFYIDNKPYAADYDPDRNLATLKLEQPLPKGYHRFQIIAYDFAGNKTVSPRVTFRVR